MATDNRSVGRFILDGIPPSPRSVPQIEVTFDIDANGILKVSAKDNGTGKEQNIRIEASTGLSQDEIERMKQEALDNSENDKKSRENADKLNSADSLIFQTEKSLNELSDKLTDDEKNQIQTSLDKLKESYKNQDMETMENDMMELSKNFSEISQKLYQTMNNNGDTPNQTDEEFSDVIFEEVN